MAISPIKMQKAFDAIQDCKESNIPYSWLMGIIVILSVAAWVPYVLVLVASVLLAPKWLTFAIAVVVGYLMWTLSTRVRWLTGRIKHIYGKCSCSQ